MGEFRFDESKLMPLIKSVVTQVLTEMEQLRRTNSNRLVYSEVEAAAMLGLHRHQLRDIRRRGEISYTRLVGRRIGYTMDDLMAYQNRGREETT
jgi:hypothetical protein